TFLNNRSPNIKHTERNREVRCGGGGDQSGAGAALPACSAPSSGRCREPETRARSGPAGAREDVNVHPRRPHGHA
ncbi:Hypothetical predicted protein, partial [Marmota monax]